MGRGRRRYEHTIFIWFIILILTAISLKLIIDYLLKTVEKFQNTSIKSIFINLQGGLGNQLFVYAGALTLKNKYAVPVFLLPVDSNSNIHSSTDYRYLFDNTPPIEYTDERMKETREVSIQNNYFGGWRDIPTDQNTNILIKYHWFQDFPSIKDVIPDVKTSVISKLSEVYKDFSVDKAGSSFVHVRRGDYTKEADGIYALQMDYYNAGLIELNKNRAIKYVYIISDDIQWCREQKWITTKEIIFFDEPDELKTLYLMSQCEGGAVISNSTFSSWGAFLGPYLVSAPIVCPKTWLFNGNLSLPTEWVRK